MQLKQGDRMASRGTPQTGDLLLFVDQIDGIYDFVQQHAVDAAIFSFDVVLKLLWNGNGLTQDGSSPGYSVSYGFDGSVVFVEFPLGELAVLWLLSGEGQAFLKKSLIIQTLGALGKYFGLQVYEVKRMQVFIFFSV